MKLTEKIWYDENSEPPKNYIWAKNGKLFKYIDGQWREVSKNDAGGDSDSGIQIVELTYDHIPATGTLSASDLAKLDSDNCLLVMKGRYFRKTFSSDSGIDYKEIGLATILGGVRSIYFTVSKPDGEYTIAYEHPVEANTQTQANATLENIKVGNTTYSVPPSPMVVEGTVDAQGNFLPASGAPTWAEAYNLMASGGIVYMKITANGETGAFLAVSYNADMIQTINTIHWSRLGGNPGDPIDPDK